MPDCDFLHSETQTWAMALTAMAPAGIAVVRVMGARALDIVRQVFRPHGTKPFAITPGRVHYGQIVDGDEVIDDVVLTGRPLGEEKRSSVEWLADINAHGGVRVVQRILMLLVRHGASLAKSQEVGLLGWPANNAVEREAWASLIRAKTHRAAMWLVCQQVALPALLQRWIVRLESAAPAAWEQVPRELEEVLSRHESARYLIDGVNVVIAGPPNAGKSTLANLLFGQPRSIVSEQPGTTRDYVAEPAAIEGVPMILTDTAGLRTADDPIEQESIVRALGRIAAADAVLLVVDGSQPLSPSTRFALDAVGAKRSTGRIILVLNKSDLPEHADWGPVVRQGGWNVVRLSASTGLNVGQLGQLFLNVLGLEDWSDQTVGVWTDRQFSDVSAAAAELPGHPRRAAERLRGLLEI